MVIIVEPLIVEKSYPLQKGERFSNNTNTLNTVVYLFCKTFTF